MQLPFQLLPDNVKPLSPRPLFPSRFGDMRTSNGLKIAWQRAMSEYVADGLERFWEHDIRAKSASDARDLPRAQELLDHATPATTQRHYRRAPAKVRPLRQKY